MLKKSVVICLQAVFLKSLSAQYIGPYSGLFNDYYPRAIYNSWDFNPYPMAYPTYPFDGPILTPSSLAASSGGSFTVRSYTPVAPTGLIINSENVFDGVVTITGRLPFLAAISLEGYLPTIGSGIIKYGCANGNIGVYNEEVETPGYGGPCSCSCGPVCSGYGGGYGIY